MERESGRIPTLKSSWSIFITAHKIQEKSATSWLAILYLLFSYANKISNIRNDIIFRHVPVTIVAAENE
jgi:hypothetical protein